jgi:hypothetical protein
MLNGRDPRDVRCCANELIEFWGDAVKSLVEHHLMIEGCVSVLAKLAQNNIGKLLVCAPDAPGLLVMSYEYKM